MLRIIYAIVALLVCTYLPFAMPQSEQGGGQQKTEQPTADNRLSYDTLNTTRLTAPNMYAAATAVTQIVYGATHHEDRPNAVTLVRADRQADAVLAASRITHFPVNSPVLYVEADRIPPETFDEIKRLEPDGNTYDSKVQVYLVGPISEKVEKEIQEKLGFKTRAFRISDPFELSEQLDTWAAAVHADHPDEVIIVQHNQLDTALSGVAWNAHMGHGLLFVDGERIPEATRKALQRRYRNESFLYLFGDSSVISDAVAAELSKYGHVQRVPGKDAHEISISFAGYRDAGMDQGFWIGSWARDFGWGIAEAGHNFTFVAPQNWQLAVTGSLLSHMGKHGPMIVLTEDAVDERLKNYLQLVQPFWTSPSDQLSNHAWILSDTNAISWNVQAEIDSLLEAR